MKHDRHFEPNYLTAVELAPGLRRLTAENPGPFTFFGTNTYLLGTRRLIVVDPGPALPAHIEAIMKAAEGATIEAIAVTHTHMDHSPGARLLKEKTGAPIVGCGRHEAARDLSRNEINPLDASSDKDHAADRQLHDGDVFAAAGIRLRTVATPGHTMNHLCFALEQEDMLLSADHVMGWATSIVAPPDGRMSAYMASIDKLLDRPEQTYLPGHGGVVHEAHAYVGELKAHRLAREASILASLDTSSLDRDGLTIAQIVTALYTDVDPALHGAAGLSVFAHLEDLAERGLVTATPDMSLQSVYRRRNAPTERQGTDS